MSLLSWIKRTLTGAPDASAAEPPPRHERREAGRERHQETGEPPGRRATGLTTRRGRGSAIVMRRRRSWATADPATEKGREETLGRGGSADRPKPALRGSRFGGDLWCGTSPYPPAESGTFCSPKGS